MSLLAIEINAAFERSQRESAERGIDYEMLWGEPEPNVQLPRQEDRQDGASRKTQTSTSRSHLHQASASFRATWQAIGLQTL